MRAALLFSVVLLGAASAAAQERSEAPTESVGLGPDEEEARAHFNLAQLQYRRGRFLDAATEFEAAYALSPRAELLYNIYIAYRDGGDLDSAARSLRRLLESDPLPRTLDREHLGARLEALEDQIRERRELEERAAAQPVPDEPVEPEPAPPPPAPSAGPWGPGFAILAAGAGVAAIGAILGGVALSLYDDVTARCEGTVCPADTEGDRATGQALTIATDVMLPVGLAAAVAGLVLAFVVVEEDEARVAVRVGPDGGALCVAGRF
ncbi:MAG: tetratricopeptide repeat protein [Sandaracinaceae bacterium]|nr:tetratricopeptide repeat protein [Sandaracinaceae bacterium]